MRLATIFICVVFLAAPCLVQADISPHMSHQGVLRDDEGNPVPDGDYQFTFSLYDRDSGGTRVWSENQTLPVEGGIYNATLGLVEPLTALAWDIPYWLAIAVEGEAELSPRIELTTVPYAAHAGYSDTCLEGDDDWTLDGDDVYHETGNVGIGLSSPSSPLDVRADSETCAQFENSGTNAEFAIRGVNSTGSAAGFYAGASTIGYPVTPAAVYATAAGTKWGGHFRAEDGRGLYAYSNTGNAIHGWAGSGYAGYFQGGLGVYVDNMLETNGLTMPTGAASGYVLTSDASGVASWEAAAGGADADWTIDGDDVYHDAGYVGIGTTAPSMALDVDGGTAKAARFVNDAGTSSFTSTTVNLSGTAGAFYSGTSPTGYPSTPAAIYGYGYDDHRGGHFSSTSGDGIYSWSSSGKAVYGKTSSGYSGYFDGGLGVYCDDMLETGQFKMSNGASNGYVLTSDAAGIGTWEPALGGADGDWTISGDDIYCATSGNVGIGTTSPGARLAIEHDPASASKAFTVSTSTTEDHPIVFSRTVAPESYQSLLSLTIPTLSPDNSRIIAASRGANYVFEVDGDGSVTARGRLNVVGDDPSQGFFATVAYGDTASALSAEVAGGSTYGQPAIYGENAATDDHGAGGKFVGGHTGVRGSVSPPSSASGMHIGVNGDVMGGIGDNYGLRGYVEFGDEAYGVYGYAAYGDEAYGVYGYAGYASVSNYAGYFAGDAHVTGELTAGTKSFKIDHPLDPEHKYLMHSCVESDDMMNIYNGNVTLDGEGEAWVSMPDWFEALNRDFRYQLTCIGGFAPVYIAEKISGGRFLIAGGEPGMEISWQVTGIRHDPLAETHPVRVEVDKRADEVGKYMHPEAYGMPRTMGIDYREERAEGRF